MSNKRNVFIAIIITAIITAVICWLVFSYIPDYQKNIKIQSYKRSVFNSVLCEYKCPLTNQTYVNKTILLPDQECVKNCTVNVKDDQEKLNDFSNNDLKKDGLTEELMVVVNNCKKTSSDPKTKILDNKIFFDCVIKALEGLKEKYPYLK